MCTRESVAFSLTAAPGLRWEGRGGGGGNVGFFPPSFRWSAAALVSFFCRHGPFRNRVSLPLHAKASLHPASHSGVSGNHGDARCTTVVCRVMR